MKQIYIVVIISLMLAACGSSTGPSGPTAAELVQQGWEARAAGDLAGAISRFDEAIEKDGGLYEAYLGKGLTYLEEGVYSIASADDFLNDILLAHKADIEAAGLREEILYPAYAAMAGYRSRDNRYYSFIIDNLVSVLVSIPVSWEYEHNTQEVVLNGGMVHLTLAEVYFYYPNATSNHLANARARLDAVRNFSGYSTLPQTVRDKADQLYAQFAAAGLY